MFHNVDTGNFWWQISGNGETWNGGIGEIDSVRFGFYGLCQLELLPRWDDMRDNKRSKFHKKFGKTKQRNWGRLWARLNQELGL